MALPGGNRSIYHSIVCVDEQLCFMSKRGCQYGVYFDYCEKYSFVKDQSVRRLETVPLPEVCVSNFEPSADTPKVLPRPFVSPVPLNLSIHNPLIAL